MQLSLKGPFEPRQASRRLRELLVDYLATHSPAVGAPFFSDNQLMEMSGLSRKAVRKAMDSLQREGWVERQIGRGSFVGPRVRAQITSAPTESPSGRHVVRLAVLAYGMSYSTPDWYSQGVLSGIDEAAIEQGVSIELLGSHTSDVSMLSRRLAQSQPDVLAVMPSTNRHTFMIGEALRLNIPCIVTGTRLLDLGLPTVYEDGQQGAAMAVRDLVQKGHRRIGMLQRPDSAPYVFARREGYVQSLAECGIEMDERLVLWMPSVADSGSVDRLRAYLDKEQPTALLLGSGQHARTVGTLIRSHGLRVPQDLSVITFDQYYEHYELSLGLRPTVVELPLRAMGQRMAQMARDLMENRPIEQATSLPCELIAGASVRDLTTH